MDVMTHSGLRLSYLSSLGSRLGAYSSTYCAPGSPRSGGVVAYFGALLYFTFRLASAFGSKSQIWPIRTPLWPAFSSRVSRRTAFILIAPDKCFPWHTISPFPHLLSFSSACLSILMTQASRLSLAWLNWWSKVLQSRTICRPFFSGRQNKAQGKRKETEGERFGRVR